MISRDYLPSGPLRDYVRLYRLRHFVLNGDRQISCKPFPPRPEQCLIFFPRGVEVSEDVCSGIKTQRPRSVISGQYTYRVNRHIQGLEFLMLEVDLQPGALHRLTGIPFKELTNTAVDAEAFFGAEIKRVNERLGSAPSYSEMIGLIEGFLQHLVRKEKKAALSIDHTLHGVIHDATDYSVDLLAQKAFLSPRQLERKFDERIGVSPKTFLRICRFNQSYWMHLKHPDWDWLRIAVACGYNDYQHLVKDYKDFANATPNNFFSEERKAPGRVLGLTR
jgi:AraC-like DNA-binding protein